MTIPLQPAKETDFPAIIAIMNAAFRGAEGEQGWSVELGFITGERINESLLREEISKGALYLLAKDEVTSDLQGCVSLQAISPEKWYLGSLTVGPALQNTGFGRALLSAAEEYTVKHGARTIEMTVVNVRDTLISWYERRGYRQTGETRPFPYGDHRYGTPTRSDLEFVVLERHLRE
ncbi:GNAT family N-acetyltransferase [Granulicella sp. S190]|jgi:ribosomal protein S18 acetylase RimI-like enzyme|uniref:GNAT family N-acetyltransferase n=1 Tax=Granulicella sp. S190 TaxID=1747226 RepID=UPI00131DC9A5|nr:GNAT family N-acetyltransferase [Granulicella sp. S190]